jgi:hypothetical protein
MRADLDDACAREQNPSSISLKSRAAKHPPKNIDWLTEVKKSPSLPILGAEA